MNPSSPFAPRSPATPQQRQAWLDAFLAEHGGIAGTVHVRRDEQLELEAATAIPEAVQAATRTIARGKGMAGLAWERGHPVQTCNLQTDTSGDVRAGARAVSAHAAVALPVCGASGELRAVVGIAFGEARELGEAELAQLSEAARALP